ncbi:(methyl)glyoxal oxidase [Sarracenia purpurea var. burkii]
MDFKNVSYLLSLITIFFLFATSQSLARLHLRPTITSREMTSPVADNSGGEWVLLYKSTGVSAMHMQLLHNGKVVIFDRTDFGTSNLPLPAGKCRRNDAVVKLDCSAHSLLYDVVSNTYRPLMVQTNVWCSSGAVHPDGTLVQTGGYLDGDRKIRLFTPCNDFQQCDWVEISQDLTVRRWYASNQILPDGRIIVVGGRRQFNYEFFPKIPAKGSFKELYQLPFLQKTTDRFEENNLYPFLHLLPDGNLYIFANRRSILFDYVKNRIVKEFPAIPGEKRNYPSSGSSVLLPLHCPSPEAEVLICGGAPNLAYFKANNLSVYVEASKTCGRLKLTDPEPHWVMEDMPMGRIMSDMLLLPCGDVLIINGASNGTAGWDDAVGAVLNPLLYIPTQPDPTRRFAVLNPTTIPRMYHSAAILLPDGRILVGGSNPHQTYNFTAPYPTELSLEAFSPPYLAPQYSNLRPSILSVMDGHQILSYGQKFSLTFTLREFRADRDISVSVIAPSFTTHSFSMNQRLVYLEIDGGVRKLSESCYKVNVIAPTSRNVAPPGYYMLFVVHGVIPSECLWIKISNG